MASPTSPGLADRGRQLALEHYQRLGFELLGRDHRVPGERIDLVVEDARTLVFVTVTTRRGGRPDPPFAPTALARRRLRALAAGWLAQHPSRPRARAARIDAVIVVLDRGGELLALEQVEDVA